MPKKLKNSQPPAKVSATGAKAWILAGWSLLRRVVCAILPQRRWLRRLVIGIVLFITVAVGTMYGIARWYIASQSGKSLVLGVSFIPDYARQLGLDPQATLSALTDQLGVRNFRLVGYWNDIEPSPGKYNFSELDWEFQQIAAVHGTVSLSIGLRQPRWPECHMPDWARSEPAAAWTPELKQFMQAVIERYKNNPALDTYELENEFFLKAFGQCTDFSRSRLVDEYNLVKRLDPKHDVIMSRSNNVLGFPVGAPRPDEFGMSIYKRVWDGTITHRYFEYPFPTWYYSFLAGAGQLLTGKGMMIHELQAEPWPPNGKPITQISLAEQDKSMDATRLKSRFAFGEATGIRTIYLWGAEWWYWRLTKAHDPSVWNVARQEFQKANQH